MTISASLPELPVSHVLPAVGAALAEQKRAVLSAPPGAGKTTLVPLYLLDQAWRGDGKIIDWLDELTADCPKKSAHSMNDQCGARCPDLPKGAVSYGL